MTSALSKRHREAPFFTQFFRPRHFRANFTAPLRQSVMYTGGGSKKDLEKLPMINYFKNVTFRFLDADVISLLSSISSIEAFTFRISSS